MTLSFPTPLGTFMIPHSERTDPEPVRSSLALARADFERGEIREALRHLRRAAEGADEAGSELRAVALARAAADLATEVGSSVAPPPAAPPAASVAPAAASVAPVSALRPNPDAALEQLLQSGRAVRVAIKRSIRDEELYVVRRADGNPAGLGARQAVLVLLEPDPEFFGSGGNAAHVKS
ncbi:MAG TPA: hypothetical protein VHB79_34190 [Polyangiaceae bacterium]|nr:hypothetical protein [Polyangiaceae bacterium]